MSELLTVRANAKINLFLGINARRDDGYHEIDTVMQSVSLADTLRIRLIPSGICLSCDNPEIPVDRRNTAYRAAEAFFDASGIDAGAEIQIEKVIPSAAGLGGGSADAAAVLVALNILCGNVLGTDALGCAALKVGADVPFCIDGGCARAGGVGEIIRERLPVPECSVLIVKSRESVSTPDAYARLDELYNGFSNVIPANPDALLTAIKAGNMVSDAACLYNIFEDAAAGLCPLAYQIRGFLTGISPGALLSGSGPSVFAVFEGEKDAENAANEVIRRFPPVTAYVCTPQEQGIVII